MKVQTRYFAFIRERLGKGSEFFELEEGATVADFLKALKEKHGNILKNVFEDDDLKTGFALALNGESIERSLWARTYLKEGDVVVILPPIAGGFT